MQKKNPSSALNKALIFVSAFVVSSLVIYQFYYYSRIKTLSGGIVATASELPNTQISPFIPKHFSAHNYMGNAGLPAAAGDTIQSSFAKAPEANYLSGKGVYGKDFLDELNIGISGKFPNHPPIGFSNLNDGDKILFSYFFKNILLPEGFSQQDETVEVSGKHFRAIKYMPARAHKTRIHTVQGNLKLLQIPINNNTEWLVIAKESLQGQHPDSLIPAQSHVPGNNVIIFPEIDFNIIKYWKPEEATFIQNAQVYSHLEERLKVKFTTTRNDTSKAGSQIVIKPPFYIYLYKAGEKKPFFHLYIGNTELLLPVRK